VAVLTFGASLTRLVDTPSAYGFNWDLSPDLFGDDPERLAARPEVRDLGVILFRETILDGQTIDGMAVLPVKGDPSLTVLSGRMPATTGEVALGPKTIDQLETGLGERIEARNADGDTIEVEVVGEVLFPTFDENPFNEGLAFHPDLAVDDAESAGFGQGMVRFEPGVSLERAVEIAEEVAPGSVTIYARPSRPPDIANLAQVRRMPMVLAAFLVLLALAAVAHALATAVRRRHRELGVMRALGFRRRQVAATVTVQSLTLVVVGLLVGMPLGIAAGRMAWTVLADGLGVAPAPSVPALSLVLLVLAAVALAVALAGLPARAAGRINAAEALRTE
jgi:predicted lysophospholipase L1 biosynthesis ABC-type transport system permease subunit